jgi:hypothetical protein
MKPPQVTEESDVETWSPRFARDIAGNKIDERTQRGNRTYVVFFLFSVHVDVAHSTSSMHPGERENMFPSEQFENSCGTSRKNCFAILVMKLCVKSLSPCQDFAFQPKRMTPGF